MVRAGGTEELDPDGALHEDGTAKRVSYTQDRPTKKRDEHGNVVFTRCTKEANPSTDASVLKNGTLHHMLKRRREAGSEGPSEKAQASAALKSERMNQQYAAVGQTMTDLARAVGVEIAEMDMSA